MDKRPGQQTYTQDWTPYPNSQGHVRRIRTSAGRTQKQSIVLRSERGCSGEIEASVGIASIAIIPGTKHEETLDRSRWTLQSTMKRYLLRVKHLEVKGRRRNYLEKTIDFGPSLDLDHVLVHVLCYEETP